MPIKARVQLRNVSNVAASKTALIDIPCGPRYHYIGIQHGFSAGTNTAAGAATNISEIRVKINGRVQRVMSGTQLRDMNLLNGTAYDAYGTTPNTGPGVVFPIFLAEPWMVDEADQDALAWATSGYSTFQIEVDLAAAATPTIAAHAIIDGSAAQSRGIVKWLRYNLAAAGTSFDWSTLDRRDFLRSISLYPDSGGSNAATPVTFRQNGSILHELSATANAGVLTNSGMTPAASGRTASIYDLVFDHDGLLDSAVPMDGTRDVTVTIAAGGTMSGTVTAIVQRLGPPE